MRYGAAASIKLMNSVYGYEGNCRQFAERGTCQYACVTGDASACGAEVMPMNAFHFIGLAEADMGSGRRRPDAARPATHSTACDLEERHMRSAILEVAGGPEVMTLVEEARPIPARGEVLIRTHAMAVSGPDALIRRGVYKWGPPLPANPGNEMTGVIVELGSDVTTVSVGDPVLLSSRELSVRGGCYSEFRAVPAAAVHVLPPSVDLKQAVVLPSYFVAHAMLSLTVTARTRSIFVNGAAGTIGAALVELAKARGLQVIGTVSSDDKAAYALSKGLDRVINYREERVLDRVMEFTGNSGVDVAFDHIIGDGFIDVLKMLADFGTAVAFNSFTPVPKEDVFHTMRELSTKSIALRVFSSHTFDHDLTVLRGLTAELIAMLAAGTIKPTIGIELPLEDVVYAHRRFDAGDVIGKIVMTP
ncbi:zinc-binding dehydrogenase [Sphingomonas sp. MG17]|uniref:Zinc-binding dehydrogenase n=1 Tax=Sphingomonas tagetis TaxID=2949092 RepID=A0A9X2HSB3_9SPHN|nr:zinc-binding dehydrogenase [Sphingomonas tagetis]MCP3732588.1 zinc-binding dehydrogenase [Sphingomonas tagetis]